jgi:hypothetical protein
VTMSERNRNKQNNVGVKRANTVLEELSLEAFLIRCDARARSPDCYPYVVVEEKMRRGCGGRRYR